MMCSSRGGINQDNATGAEPPRQAGCYKLLLAGPAHMHTAHAANMQHPPHQAGPSSTHPGHFTLLRALTCPT